MQKNQLTVSLETVVTDQDRLVVDEYQRTYQWEKEQIEDLFQDLRDAVGDGENHFFGTLILQSGKSNTVNIVDGQQRLTTVFMVVAALRDQIVALGEETLPPQGAKEMPLNVMEKARKFLYFSNTYDSIRLTPNQFVRDLFASSVMAVGQDKKKMPDRHRRSTLAFRKAYTQITKSVDGMLEGLEGTDRLRQINLFLDTLTRRFLVLRVATESLSESLEIFLTLNNRGLPLGPSDLVRGQVLSAMGYGLSERDQIHLQEKVNNEWEEVMELVEEPETFLRHYLVARTAEKIQKKKVVKQVESIIAGAPEEKKKRASELWDDLLEAAEVYAQIIKPDMGGGIQKQLKLVNPLSKSHRIILLSAFRHVSDTELLTDIVRLTATLAFRWVVAGGNAQRLEDFFQETCAHQEQSDYGPLLVRTLADKIESFSLNAGEYFASEADRTYVTRALLYAINDLLADGAVTLPHSSTEVHLEHVAPKSSTDNWRAELQAENDPDEYSRIISSGGNLTLLDKKLNLGASQKSFSKKVSDEYHKSAVHITRDLDKISHWDREIIGARTRWLAQMFDLIFSTQGSDAEKIIPFHKWLDGQNKA